jgi:predicted nucleic acid-binding protein
VREIFVDASFWVALFYRHDEHHEAAKTAWREVEEGKWPTVTTNWTLYEALIFFNSKRRGRHDLALEILEYVQKASDIMPVEGVNLEARSLEIFRAHADKRWSVVDCANFASIEQRRSEYALSYDGNFRQAQQEFLFQLLAP